ncbi:MAG: pectate lyase [Bacteroidota bacterium]
MKLKSKLSVFLLSVVFGFVSCNTEEPSTQEESSVAVKSKSNSLSKVGNCAQVPGWASQNGGTTGGGSAAETLVTTYAQLKAAIENKNVKIVKVSGTINIPSGGRISFQDQIGKTIYGASGAKLVSTDQSKDKSGIIYIKRCNNIIIRNLIFDGPGAYDVDGWDNCTLDDSKNVWIDHCEFRDGVDGNLDFKNKTNFVSVTYTKFNYLKAPRAGGPGGSDDHRFSNLIGSGDSATGDRGTFKITFARCWWMQGCKARMPRVRFGQVHIVNSYFNSTASTYCIQAGFEANIRITKNVFENVKYPVDLMDGKSTAVTVESNNIFTNTSGNKAGKNNAFTPPYSIVTLDASAVKANITSSSTGAGANLGGNICGSF